MHTRLLGFAALVSFLAACGGGDDGGGEGEPDAMPAACTPVAGAAAERVTTTSGVVRGVRAGETWAYKRIPYAAPPVGPRRLRAPEPAPCAAEELDASAYGPRCAQLDEGVFVGDEDCLHVNLWAPAGAAAPRPVMVWIHGGGNQIGAGVDPVYDGRRLAEAGDVVVVTINYRLAQLGWLAHPALAAETPGVAGAGVYGTLDQLAALRWVQANVAGFGGDPGNVTIVGESAGGVNVCNLVGSPVAGGLFHRAIVQSGGCRSVMPRAAAEAQAAQVASAAGCTGDVPACLRAMSAEALVRTLPGEASVLQGAPYGPTLDGLTFVELPQAAIAAGRHHRVPLMVGSNADETGKVVPAIASVAAYESLVRTTYGALADRILQQYPASRFATPRAAYVRVTSDARFVCPSREIARAADAGQEQPVYRYFFQHAASPFGAVHALEIPFLFGTFDTIAGAGGQPYQPTADDLAVSAAMQAAWTRFARTGDPGTTPAWPAWTPADPVLVIEPTVSTTSGIRTDDCDFWRALTGG